MITASNIQQGAQWAGTSVHPHNPQRRVPNKETTMDWAEHQRIVFEARRLLENRPQLGGNQQYITTAFFELYTAYTRPQEIEIKVTKGIHQPDVNPHMQVTTRNLRSGAVNTFHLAVSAQGFDANDIADVPALDGRMRWEGVQFTFIGPNGTVYAWPIDSVIISKQRRRSIGPVELQRHVTRLNAIRAQRERDRAAAAQQARANQAASDELVFQAALDAFAKTHKIHVNVLRHHTQFVALQRGRQIDLRFPDGRSRKVQFNRPGGQINILS